MYASSLRALVPSGILQLIPRSARRAVGVARPVRNGQLLAAVLPLISSLSLAAQTPTHLPLAARVRLRLMDAPNANWVVGRVLGENADSVFLGIEGEDPALRIAWKDVSAAALSDGLRSRARAGALIGGAVGLGVTALLLTDTEMLSDTAPLPVAFSVAIVAPAALGALLGAAVRTERWWPFNPPRVSLGGAGNGALLLTAGLTR